MQNIQSTPKLQVVILNCLLMVTHLRYCENNILNFSETLQKFYGIFWSGNIKCHQHTCSSSYLSCIFFSVSELHVGRETFNSIWRYGIPIENIYFFIFVIFILLQYLIHTHCLCFYFKIFICILAIFFLSNIQ